jgi:hypothetical protein
MQSSKIPPILLCFSRNRRDARAQRSAVGVAAQRIWIEDYSKRVRPLIELTKKGAHFHWNEKCQAAFNELKQLVMRAPILRPINYKDPRKIILQVDSSSIAAGFMLGQEGDNGRFHPSRYGLRPMNERESRYSQAKLELYGLFIALKSWRVYLSGIPFTVYMDAKYVKGMLKNFDPLPSAAENRWKAAILLFDFDIGHKPAAQMKAVDALSRRTPTAEELKALAEEEEEDKNGLGWPDNAGLLIQELSAIETDLVGCRVPAPLHNLNFAARVDPEDRVKEIHRFLTEGHIPSFDTARERYQFLKKTERFSIINGRMH